MRQKDTAKLETKKNNHVVRCHMNKISLNSFSSALNQIKFNLPFF